MLYNYNTRRDPIILKEYGRNIQLLVKHLEGIKDKTTRTQHAKAIQKIMSLLNTKLNDDMQKRWDSLYLISDGSLDIDSPFPPPEKKEQDAPPDRVPYVKSRLRYKNYGRNVTLLIEKTAEMSCPEMQTKMVIYIAKLMKGFRNAWQNEGTDTATILKQIQQIAPREIPVDFEKIKTIVAQYEPQPMPKQKPQQKHYKHGRHAGKRKKNGYVQG